MSRPFQCCGGHAYDVNIWIACQRPGVIKQKINYADDLPLPKTLSKFIK